MAVLGAHNLSQTEDTQVRLTSTNIVNHEGYTEFLENDVALVILPYAVALGDAIQIIPLASSSPSYEGSSAYLTGWGMTADDSGVSPVLRGVSLDVISNEECAVRYLLIRPSNICTSGAGKSIFLFILHIYNSFVLQMLSEHATATLEVHWLSTASRSA